MRATVNKLEYKSFTQTKIKAEVAAIIVVNEVNETMQMRNLEAFIVPCRASHHVQEP